MTEHRLHGIHTIRSVMGTGHGHQRATLDWGGLRAAYWRCDSGIGPLRHCPDEQDPVERLYIKTAQRPSAEEPSAPVAPPKSEKPCPRNHPLSRMRRYLSGGEYERTCLSCKAEWAARRKGRVA